MKPLLPTFEELEGGLLYAMGGRPKGLVVNGEPRARAAQLSDVRLILSPLYLLLRLRWRTEFSLWGLALPRAPGLICLLAAVLRLLFCGRKLGRKRYRDKIKRGLDEISKLVVFGGGMALKLRVRTF